MVACMVWELSMPDLGLVLGRVPSLSDHCLCHRDREKGWVIKELSSRYHQSSPTMGVHEI